MRALTSAVLITEAITLGLLIPVVLVAYDLPAAVAWFVGAIALLALLLPGLYRRPFFEPMGWLVQGATIACGLFVPMMFVLGGVFAALWWTALHLGKKVERQQASAQAGQ